MDPNEALTCLLQALHEEDREASLKYAEALIDWLKLDGFFPSVMQCVARMEYVERKKGKKRK